jgi:hypothetical protein
MAVIYLEHPKHGEKVACSEIEAAIDEKNGWARRKVAALLQSSQAPVNAPVNALIRTEPDADELASLRMRYEAKFGAQPHHRKSAATLRAELAE